MDSEIESNINVDTMGTETVLKRTGVKVTLMQKLFY